MGRFDEVLGRNSECTSTQEYDLKWTNIITTNIEQNTDSSFFTVHNVDGTTIMKEDLIILEKICEEEHFILRRTMINDLCANITIYYKDIAHWKEELAKVQHSEFLLRRVKRISALAISLCITILLGSIFFVMIQ
ncbi:MAG: hypothetical protein ACRC5M_00250 [Anaeroplasmataceae bacterium]